MKDIRRPLWTFSVAPGSAGSQLLIFRYFQYSNIILYTTVTKPFHKEFVFLKPIRCAAKKAFRATGPFGGPSPFPAHVLYRLGETITPTAVLGTRSISGVVAPRGGRAITHSITLPSCPDEKLMPSSTFGKLPKKLSVRPLMRPIQTHRSTRASC